jgi:hypothetical protein
MARDIPAIQQNAAIGITPVYTAVSVNNDQIVNNARRVLVVKNGGAGSLNVTIKAPMAATVGGIPLADKVVPVVAGAEGHFGPWGAEWNQPDGNVYIDYSVITSVTRGVFERPVV